MSEPHRDSRGHHAHAGSNHEDLPSPFMIDWPAVESGVATVLDRIVER